MSSPLVNKFDVRNFFISAKVEKRTTQFRKNQVIFSQGDRSEALFYIENGTVKLTVVSKAGKEAIVSVADGGSFFGEGCISLDHAINFQSAVALTNVQLVRIDAAVVKRIIYEGGDTALSLVALLIAQNKLIQADLASRLVESSEESLARVISSLVRFGDRQGGTVSPKISQQTLAEMVGISRQHVNALMKRLRKAESSRILSTNFSKASPPSTPSEASEQSDSSDAVQQRDRRRA
jgi:CRP-like cAMP-binding protein